MLCILARETAGLPQCNSELFNGSIIGHNDQSVIVEVILVKSLFVHPSGKFLVSPLSGDYFSVSSVQENGKARAYTPSFDFSFHMHMGLKAFGVYTTGGDIPWLLCSFSSLSKYTLQICPEVSLSTNSQGTLPREEIFIALFGAIKSKL